MFKLFLIIIIIITENNKIVDAIACVIKYFNDDSDDRVLDLLAINGIIDNKLISSPSHIPIQEYEEIDTRVPIIIDVVNIILYILVIKKKRIIAFISGV